MGPAKSENSIRVAFGGPAGIRLYLDRVLCIRSECAGSVASRGQVYKAEYRPGQDKTSAKDGESVNLIHLLFLLGEPWSCRDPNWAPVQGQSLSKIQVRTRRIARHSPDLQSWEISRINQALRRVVLSGSQLNERPLRILKMY